MSQPATTGTGATARGVWSEHEHARFVEALQVYPNGPWKAVADFVGTRTVRQVQTHAQKYHERAARRLRDLRHDRERLPQPDPRIDDEMKEICRSLQRHRVPLSPRPVENHNPQQEQQRPAVQRAASFSHEYVAFLIEALECHRSSASENGSPRATANEF